MALCAHKELQIARVCFAATCVLVAGLIIYLLDQAYTAQVIEDTQRLNKIIWLAATSLFLVYGNFLYQACIIGHFKRAKAHRPTDKGELEALHDHDFPSMSFLIPAYKEEPEIMWQTLISSALVEYGAKDIVLLIDDPYQPKSAEDAKKLEEARALSVSMQDLFDAPSKQFAQAAREFALRAEYGALDSAKEWQQLSRHYEEVVQWVEKVAAEFLKGRTRPSLSHGEVFFYDEILMRCANDHRATAELFRHKNELDVALMQRHYRRLMHLFDVRFSSFERKKYAHLSHEANKAMNLNAYLSVMGRHWTEEDTDQGLILRETSRANASFSPAGSEYLTIIDADTILLPDYALRLMHEMAKPEHSAVGVIQCYPSAFPNIPKGIERMAGATINLLFRINQGGQHLGGPFWMGANAVVRRTALEAIARPAISEGKPSTIYIQDGTVIEDTETTLALLHKGWRVYQYPERMAFFSSPPDFGSLLIQRRRWANGGILLIPSLLRYIWHAPKNWALVKELFVRVDYLTWGPVGCIMGVLMSCILFGDLIQSPFVMLLPLPCLILQLRTLKAEGYGYSDSLRLTAFGTMLGPVIMGGVLKSFQQALTGKKIPFARTPKVSSRTAAPALYAWIELLLPLLMIRLTYRYVEHDSFAQAGFTLLSVLTSFYALTYYIGWRALVEDMFGTLGKRLRMATARRVKETSPIAVREQAPSSASVGEVELRT